MVGSGYPATDEAGARNNELYVKILFFNSTDASIVIAGSSESLVLNDTDRLVAAVVLIHANKESLGMQLAKCAAREVKI